MPEVSRSDGRALDTQVHVHVAGPDPDAIPVVLLHGSDGDEHDLLAFAAGVAPGASRLGVRGRVATESGFAFFRRFPDRRVDEADIVSRLSALADLVQTAEGSSGFRKEPIAIGYSNGAIMAAALLVTRPGLLAGAVLLRPLFPLSGDFDGVLHGTPVLVIDGAHDARRDALDGVRTAQALRRAGGSVTHHVLPVGHAITPADLEIAHEWYVASDEPGERT